MSIMVGVAIKRRDKARERLFAAGWKPHMMSSPDDKYYDLLIALNEANVAVTRAKLDEYERSGR
jgi:hypothetical protein